jgi:hypothetical protein
MNKGITGLKSGTLLNLRILLPEKAIYDKISINKYNSIQKNITLGNNSTVLGYKAVSLGN